MKALANLAVRILALYFIIFGLIFSVNTLIYTVMQYAISKDIGIWQIIVSPACYLVFGALLWFSSGFISNIVCKKTDNDLKEISINISYDAVLRLAFIIIGGSIIVNSVPKIVGAIYIISSMSDVIESTFAIQQKSNLIESIIESIIGVFLILGYKGVVKTIQKVIDLGIDNKNIEPDDEKDSID